MKTKSFIYPIAFMSVLTIVFTFVLAYLDQSTAERVALLQELDLQKKILYVFDIEVPSGDDEEISEVFDANIKTEKLDDKIIYVYEQNQEILGYAFPIAGAGLWGSIDGYVGISADYSTLLGLNFITQSETPGLGGRIEEAEYLEQFRNLDVSEVTGSDYLIYRPAQGGNIDAIAGATLTSQSVVSFMNDDIEEFISARKGE